MAHTVYTTVGHTFTFEECPECGCWFGMENNYANARRDDKKLFYCPNGHSMSYSKTRLDSERELHDRKVRELQSQINTVHNKLISKEKEAAKLRKEIRDIKKTTP